MSWFEKEASGSGKKWQFSFSENHVRPSDEMLLALRVAVASAGAELAYWCWCSVDDELPRLTVAFSPGLHDVADKIAPEVDRILKTHLPTNSSFTLLALGDPNLDPAVLKVGELLFDSTDSWLK